MLNSDFLLSLKTAVGLIRQVIPKTLDVSFRYLSLGFTAYKMVNANCERLMTAAIGIANSCYYGDKRTLDLVTYGRQPFT